MKKPIDLVMCCFREGSPLCQPDARGCRALAMGNPKRRTRAHLEQHHVRCDRHNRPIVFVALGALAHLAPIEERPSC